MSINRPKKTMDGVRIKKRTRPTRSFERDDSATSLGINSQKISEIKKRKKEITRTQKKSIHPTQLVEKKNINRFKPAKKRTPFLNIEKRIFNYKSTRWVFKIIFVVILLVVFFNTKEKTTITLRPHYQYVEMENIINTYRNPKQEQLGFDIIAITDTSSISIIADETRPVSFKSTGEIIIYNNFSSEPQRLLANTRFKSASGKIFLLDDNEVIVPGKKGSTPGSIKVSVFAEKAGKEYNIDITDFSIPGFKEAGLINKYNGMYAVSTKSMAGGEIGTESYISNNKKEEAQEKLTQDLSKRLREKLQKEKTDNVIVVTGSEQFIFKETLYTSDDTGSAGILSREGTIVAIVIGKENIGNYIADNYLEKADSQEVKLLSANAIKVSLENGDTLDLKDLNFAKIRVYGSPLYSWIVNKEEVKEKISGVLKKEVVDVIDMIPSIDRAHIQIRPFWKQTISKDPKDIIITIDI